MSHMNLTFHVALLKSSLPLLMQPNAQLEDAHGGTELKDDNGHEIRSYLASLPCGAEDTVCLLDEFDEVMDTNPGGHGTTRQI